MNPLTKLPVPDPEVFTSEEPPTRTRLDDIGELVRVGRTLSDAQLRLVVSFAKRLAGQRA